MGLIRVGTEAMAHRQGAWTQVCVNSGDSNDFAMRRADTHDIAVRDIEVGEIKRAEECRVIGLAPSQARIMAPRGIVEIVGATGDQHKRKVIRRFWYIAAFCEYLAQAGVVLAL